MILSKENEEFLNKYMNLYDVKFKPGDLVACDEEGVKIAIVLSSSVRLEGGRRYVCKVIECNDPSRKPMILHSDNYHLHALDLPEEFHKLTRLFYQ